MQQQTAALAIHLVYYVQGETFSKVNSAIVAMATYCSRKELANNGQWRQKHEKNVIWDFIYQLSSWESGVNTFKGLFFSRKEKHETPLGCWQVVSDNESRLCFCSSLWKFSLWLVIQAALLGKAKHMLYIQLVHLHPSAENLQRNENDFSHDTVMQG